MRNATGIILLGLVLCAVTVAIAAVESSHPPTANIQYPPVYPPAPKVSLAGIHKIKHVILIMQENRSFDNYFGTYPGADGIPMQNGSPTVCIPDPLKHVCVKPYHDRSFIDGGGPHGTLPALADIDHGKMDGFIRSAANAISGKYCHEHPDAALCVFAAKPEDVMGYYTSAEIPNYWTYAHDFVLQDHMFEPNFGWSLPAHLFTVSGWSARCHNVLLPLTCRTSLGDPGADRRPAHGPRFGWTDLTYLLYTHHVSWRYFIQPGTSPDCADGGMFCKPMPQSKRTPSIWNPLPEFATVHLDHQLGNMQAEKQYFKDASAGKLPAVSWIAPNGYYSEHPPVPISHGQWWTTRLINAAMHSPDWGSTAIFLFWDDWGGFYDNVIPPRVDQVGYGLRVPGLVISPYAKRGYIDSQVLSFDAYLKFIEDDFLGSQRIDKTDGRPDSRPDVRENATVLGNLVRDFNFNQKPRAPIILPPCPFSASVCRGQDLPAPSSS